MLMFPVLDDRMATASMAFVDTPLFDGPAAARMWSIVPRREPIVDLCLRRARTRRRSAWAPSDVPRNWGVRSAPRRRIAYAVRLLAADVSVELHNFAGTFHTFDVFPTGNIDTRQERTSRVACVASRIA
jgi:hypothetical protein